MAYHLTLTPHGSLIARDGRPFGIGQRMKSLGWLYPSVLAGSLRTLLGKQQGGRFDARLVAELKAIEIAGPLPCIGKDLYVPAPQDVLVGKAPPRLCAVRPTEVRDCGCDLPEAGLLPVLPPTQDEFKPLAPPPFWSVERMAEWLASPLGDGFVTPPAIGAGEVDGGYWGGPEDEARIHVQIDARTGAAAETRLFRTVGLAMGDGVMLAARVEASGGLAEELGTLSALHPCGGERRLATWEADASAAPSWKCPDSLAQKVGEATRLRLVLATPALFDYGWTPAWLADGLKGTLPGTDCGATLIGACLGRWRPISGWSFEPPVGPKAVRRLVPAGSVYFLTLDRPLAANTVRRLWLQSVCDNEQDRRDGFGLALWGVWDQYGQGGME